MSEAVQLYRKAAEQGHDRAQQILGNCYQDGTGVARNVIEAYVWMSLSAENGGAVDGGGAAGELLDAMSKGLTPAELAQAQAEVSKRQQEITERINANNQEIINELNGGGSRVTITRTNDGSYNATATQPNHCTYSCSSPNLRIAFRGVLGHFRNYMWFPSKSE